jgi:hypothetical protein
MSALDGDDRELWAVLVALEPLDARKWNYVDLTRRTFDAERCLQEPWSSGERVLVEVAASLWNSGTVDLGYIACAMGGRHLQAVVDAVAIRAGKNVTSDIATAVRRVGEVRRPAVGRPRDLRPGPQHTRQIPAPPTDRQAPARER